MMTLAQLANMNASAAFAALNANSTVFDLLDILNQSMSTFPLGGSELPAELVSLLRTAAGFINKLVSSGRRLDPSSSITKVEIAAYADRMPGDAAASLPLWQRRTDAINNELVRAGVYPAMLVCHRPWL